MSCNKNILIYKLYLRFLINNLNSNIRLFLNINDFFLKKLKLNFEIQKEEGKLKMIKKSCKH